MASLTDHSGVLEDNAVAHVDNSTRPAISNHPASRHLRRFDAAFLRSQRRELAQRSVDSQMHFERDESFERAVQPGMSATRGPVITRGLNNNRQHQTHRINNGGLPATNAGAKTFLTSLPPLYLTDLLEEHQECPLCFESYENSLHSESPIRLPCNHVMGKDCLKQWLMSSVLNVNNNACPICRTRLFERDLVSVEHRLQGMDKEADRILEHRLQGMYEETDRILEQHNRTEARFREIMARTPGLENEAARSDRRTAALREASARATGPETERADRHAAAVENILVRPDDLESEHADRRMAAPETLTRAHNPEIERAERDIAALEEIAGRGRERVAGRMAALEGIMARTQDPEREHVDQNVAALERHNRRMATLREMALTVGSERERATRVTAELQEIEARVHRPEREQADRRTPAPDEIIAGAQDPERERLDRNIAAMERHNRRMATLRGMARTTGSERERATRVVAELQEAEARTHHAQREQADRRMATTNLARTDNPEIERTDRSIAALEEFTARTARNIAASQEFAARTTGPNMQRDDPVLARLQEIEERARRPQRERPDPVIAELQEVAARLTGPGRENIEQSITALQGIEARRNAALRENLARTHDSETERRGLAVGVSENGARWIAEQERMRRRAGS